jgi:hypothetical protein
MRHGCEVAISGDLVGPGHREPALWPSSLAAVPVQFP